MNKKFDWANHEAVTKAVKEWLKNRKYFEILPAKAWLNPLNIDVLTRKTCPEELYLFELYEIKTRREDIQRAPYQLETCRIRLEDQGATRCYVALPHWLINQLDKCGEYPFFIAAMKRFGYGIVDISPALIPTVYMEPLTFKRVKEATWK
jgi:hypothetical protein